MLWKKMLVWATGQIDETLHQQLEFVLEETVRSGFHSALRLPPTFLPELGRSGIEIQFAIEFSQWTLPPVAGVNRKNFLIHQGGR